MPHYRDVLRNMQVSSRPTMISYTIYGDNAVGITIKPTPSLSRVELNRLITELQQVEAEMRTL
jgi:hypothetical protein